MCQGDIPSSIAPSASISIIDQQGREEQELRRVLSGIGSGQFAFMSKEGLDFYSFRLGRGSGGGGNGPISTSYDPNECPRTPWYKDGQRKVAEVWTEIYGPYKKYGLFGNIFPGPFNLINQVTADLQSKQFKATDIQYQCAWRGAMDW